MISIEQALLFLEQKIGFLPSEEVFLDRALGRILREDCCAKRDMPPWPSSAMDGYAVKSSSLEGASKEHPVSLKIREEIKASYFSTTELKEDECFRIFTGAPVPSNADSVVMQEDVELKKEGFALFSDQVLQGNSIRQQGEDYQQGQLLLKRGQALDANALGVLASQGMSHILVSKKPTVALFSCGDELVPFHREPLLGQIRDSNRFTLLAQVQEAGGIPSLLPLTSDDPIQIEQQLQEGLESDLLITSGGASVGDYDLILPTLRKLGVEIHFWKIAMKPGKPLIFGSKGKTLVFGLPGNPISSMVTFELFVRPTLRKMQGFSNPFRKKVWVTLSENIENNPKRTHFVRGHWVVSEKETFFQPLSNQSSGNILSMSQVDALAILPPRTFPYQKGEKVCVLDLSPFWQGSPSF